MAQLPFLPNLKDAVTEFNSVPSKRRPYRNVPSWFIALFSHPDMTTVEPDWNQAMLFFSDPKTDNGPANLQDLHLFIVRVALPNLIMRNRELLLQAYRANPSLLANSYLRYDGRGWDNTSLGQQSPAAHVVLVHPGMGNTVHDPLRIPTRPIFTSRPTPTGQQFLQWLNAQAFANAGVQQTMRHIPGEMDITISRNEVVIRQWSLEDLLRATHRALKMYWWLHCANKKLEQYKDNHWQGISNEFY